MINIQQHIVDQIKQRTCIAVLAHQNPDGDTLGAAFALYYALKKIGKRVNVHCSDVFPDKFSYLYQDFEQDDFEPDYIISVDIADVKLLGPKTQQYQHRIDLCIDHHVSNPGFGKQNLIDAAASATCEVVFELIQRLDIVLDVNMANSLYTGILTDTGCFKYPSTTAATHRIAADLIQAGCDYAAINKKLFDTKTKSRIAIERQFLDNITYHFDQRVALATLSQKMMTNSGADAMELDGLSAIPRQIEGVEVGVTLRERPEGGYRVSMRTCDRVDASEICAKLGGGGHKRAAGCLIKLPHQQTVQQIMEILQPYFWTMDA